MKPYFQILGGPTGFLAISSSRIQLVRNYKESLWNLLDRNIEPRRNREHLIYPTLDMLICSKKAYSAEKNEYKLIR